VIAPLMFPDRSQLLSALVLLSLVGSLGYQRAGACVKENVCPLLHCSKHAGIFRCVSPGYSGTCLLPLFFVLGPFLLAPSYPGLIIRILLDSGRLLSLSCSSRACFVLKSWLSDTPLSSLHLREVTCRKWVSQLWIRYR